MNSKINHGYEELYKNSEIISLRITAAVYDDLRLQRNLSERNVYNILKPCIIELNAHLISAVRFGYPSLLIDYVKWLKIFLNNKKFPVETVAAVLKHLREKIGSFLNNNELDISYKYLNGIISEYSNYEETKPTFINVDSELGLMTYQFTQALLNHDRPGAEKVINNALLRGRSIKEIYLKILQVSLYEIGRLWQENKISIAKEHYCTSLIQILMSQFYPKIFNRQKNGKKMVSTGIAGNTHEIGIRMITDMFEHNGWKTIYLGADLPAESTFAFLMEEKPELLALSATMGSHLHELAELINRIREDKEIKNTKILVGGNPFILAPNLWKQIGADAMGKNVLDAVDNVNSLF